LLAVSVVNQSRVYHKKVDVDIREWHNYTIQWTENNATFLVDGITVATTEKVPRKIGLGFYAGVDNSCHQYRGDPQTGTGKPEDAYAYFWNGIWEIPLALNHTFSLILDRYEITAPDNSEVFTNLLEEADQRIADAETAGANTTYLWKTHRESFLELEATSYLGSSSYIAMTAIREHLLGITNHLVSATEALTSARENRRDRDLEIMRAQYQLAVTYLITNQPEEAERYLDMIMTRDN
jgi:hypothetical protein